MNNLFFAFTSKILKSFGVRYYEWFRYNDKNKKFRYCRIDTSNHEYFTRLRSVFYPSMRRNKIVCRDVLNRLNALGLCVWYLDDGSYNYSSKNISITTCMNEFSVQEVFRDYFKEVWGLDIIIRSREKRGKVVHYIWFDVISSDKFLRIIKKYVPKCLNYKLGHLHKSNLKKLCRARKMASSRQKKYRSTEIGKLKTKENNNRYYHNNKERFKEYGRWYYRKNRKRLSVWRDKNREYCE